MTKFRYQSLLALLCLIFVNVVAFSQQKPSESTYLLWKADQQKLQGNKLNPGHLGVGLSVSKYKDIGVQVEFSVFTEATSISVPNLQFSVQPLGTTTDAGGKVELIDIGTLSSITFRGSGKLSRKENGLLAQPELISRVPSETKAVRVTISGDGNGQISVIMPLTDSIASAVLAKNLICEKSSESACSWWTGNCPGQCQGMLCAACDNDSPTLNCASCQMGCSGSGQGSNCTPTTDPPLGCPATRKDQ